MAFDDFLAYIDNMDEPLPYCNRTLVIVLDAIARTIAANDFILPPEKRTSAAILNGIGSQAMLILNELALLSAESTKDDVLSLWRSLNNTAEMYIHQQMQRSGEPFSQCTLSPPCPHHPEP